MFGSGQLSKDEVERYARQLLLSQVGSLGGRHLRDARVLIVGCGGLGSTAAPYLAAAGVGELILVDDDRVDRSNLHRQVIHQDASIGNLKAESAAHYCRSLNPDCQIVAVSERLSVLNALELVSRVDVAVDATDNVSSRYLLNDACMLMGRPLVSGSALRWEGHLTVYGFGSEGPCYRCIVPDPPPPSCVGTCAEHGVIGPIPGMIGCQQSLETIKCILNLKGHVTLPTLSGRLFCMDGLAAVTRIAQLRSRLTTCAYCSSYIAINNRRIHQLKSETVLVTSETSQQLNNHLYRDTDSNSLSSHLVLDDDDDDLLPSMTAKEFAQTRPDFLVLDVRSPVEFALASLNHSVNIPLDELLCLSPIKLSHRIELWIQESTAIEPVTISVLCRCGTRAARATESCLCAQTELIKRSDSSLFTRIIFKYVEGGYNELSKYLSFPLY